MVEANAQTAQWDEVERDPDGAEWNTYGVALWSGAAPKADALVAFEFATEANPTLADAWYNRAVALRHVAHPSEGRIAESVSSLDRALAIEPSHSDAAHLRPRFARADFAAVLNGAMPSPEERAEAAAAMGV